MPFIPIHLSLILPTCSPPALIGASPGSRVFSPLALTAGTTTCLPNALYLRPPTKGYSDQPTRNLSSSSSPDLGRSHYETYFQVSCLLRATQPHACPVPANPHEHPSSNHFPPYPFRSPVHALTRQTCKDKHRTGNTGQNKQGRGKETWRVRLCIHSACPSDPGGVKCLAFACDICQPLPCFEGFACVFIQIPGLSMRRFFFNLILSGLSYLSTVRTLHSRRLFYTL